MFTATLTKIKMQFWQVCFWTDSVSQIMALSPSKTTNFQSILYYSFCALKNTQYFNSQLNVQYTLKILKIFSQLSKSYSRLKRIKGSQNMSLQLVSTKRPHYLIWGNYELFLKWRCNTEHKNSFTNALSNQFRNWT